jgi:PEP-CTERM motif-containing protein
VANLNNDNVVNNADLQGLIVALANGGGGGSISAVPEPGSLALMAIGGLIVVATFSRAGARGLVARGGHANA